MGEITCCWHCERRVLHCRENCPDWAKHQAKVEEKRAARAIEVAGRYSTYDSEKVNRATRDKRKGQLSWRWR